MGEYEPNDSRNITQSNDTAPGEPSRTGPREDQARPGLGKYSAGQTDQGEQGVRAAPQSGQSQSQGQQSQSLGGMSQSQGDSGQGPSSEAGAGDSAPMQGASGGGEAGNPQNMQQDDSEEERRRRQQAAGQEGAAPQGYGFAPSNDEERERGYGGAGEERMKRIEER